MKSLVVFFGWSVLVGLSVGLSGGSSALAANNAVAVFKKHESRIMSAVYCQEDATGGVFEGLITDCNGHFGQDQGVAVHADKLCYAQVVEELLALSKETGGQVVCRGKNEWVVTIEGENFLVMNIGRAVAW